MKICISFIQTNVDVNVEPNIFKDEEEEEDNEEER